MLMVHTNKSINFIIKALNLFDRARAICLTDLYSSHYFLYYVLYFHRSFCINSLQSKCQLNSYFINFIVSLNSSNSFI